jgi:group I intron endonuclease
MENIYYIYHIPNYVNKGKKWEGVLGKIGVTEDLKRRTGQYKYKYELLEMESHTCIYKVSDREQELQRQYKYPVDKKPYWKKVEETQRPESRAKMSENHAKFWKDKTHSEETIGKMSESKTGDKNPFFGKTHSEESKIKNSESTEKHAVNQYSKDNTFIAQYPSLIEAYRQTGVDFGNIRHCCRGHYKTAGGYIWEYAD